MSTQRGQYDFMDTIWNMAECYALAFVVAQAGDDADALERTDDHLERAARQIAEITGQDAAAIRLRLVADAHDVVAVSAPLVVRAGDVITDPVRPVLIALPGGETRKTKPARWRGQSRTPKRAPFQVGDLVMQNYPEQELAFRVTKISADGAWITATQYNGSTPGRTINDQASGMVRVTQAAVDGQVKIETGHGEHRARIIQSIVSRHAGKYRVVCRCLVGLEVNRTGRKVGWCSSVEAAQELHAWHAAGEHGTAPADFVPAAAA